MMRCAACASKVEKTLQKQSGVLSATVNFAAASVTVAYDASIIGPAQLKAALQAVGYELVTEGSEQARRQQADTSRTLRRKTVIAAVLSLPVLVLSMVFPNNTPCAWVSCLLATPVVLFIGRDFHSHALKELKARSTGMDSLVSLSTLTAYAFSCFNLFFSSLWTAHGITPHVYFESASVIITFILAGRALEERAKSNTNAAVSRLIKLSPSRAYVLNSHNEIIEIDVNEIRAGQTVIIRPGDRIPADGIVSEGSSYVDESMMTGEPMPVVKEKGAHVFAGTLNLHGAFRFTAQQTGERTLLSKIIEMVREAQGSKAPVQRLADRIASVFVPAVFTVALTAFILWLVFGGNSSLPHAVIAFVTTLIVACPCALGLATPAALTVAIGRAAQDGILIRNAESLQTASKTDLIVFDKTGTVTQGRPQVVKIFWDEENQMLANIFFSLETLSRHPLAKALINNLYGTLLPVTEFKEQAGGVTARYNGTTYYACNETTLIKNNIPINEKLKAETERLRRKGHTLVFFASSAATHALCALSDTIRPSAPEAVKLLQNMGLQVHLLTGDSAHTAALIARQAHIKHFRAGVSPLEKANYIKGLQAQHHCVGMAGDGINDSAALAQADLSIAPSQGSDIAIHAAQITILSTDLTKISTLIGLSRRTMTIIRQNLFWAFAYNTLAIPAAAGALYPLCGLTLSPMLAAAAMALSSLTVTLNSLRLRNYKSTNHKTMKREYRIEGMMCPHCKARVEKILNDMPDVRAAVSLNPPVAVIEFKGEMLPLARLQAALQAEGYNITEE